MKILVTGSSGFVGSNLVCALRNNGYTDIYEFDKGVPLRKDDYDICFHFAGVNRPKEVWEFYTGNLELTDELIKMLPQKCRIFFSSSIQVVKDNDYGKSKRAAEDLLNKRGNAYICRFPNIFGKWNRPNYNGVVATFCQNIARGLPIQINGVDTAISLVYIDDVIKKCLAFAKETEYELPVYDVTLGEIAELIYSFKESRSNLSVPVLTDGFEKKLYSTYLSYLPEDELAYPLKMNVDNRGSFTEIIKTPDRGQVSVNITKPGITKGNHWHDTKCEKFVVVSGNAQIKFRKIGTDKVITVDVNGEKIEVVDIPPGYTHNITNTGENDLITMMWANELYDPENPDTYFEEV